jgi:hypothetical protein
MPGALRIDSVRGMARKAGPTDEDYESAARLGLLGLMADQDADSIMEQLLALHPRNNTFPAEVLLELAAEAIEESGASPADPIQYEGMRDRHLPEYHFRGKFQQHKSHYALMAAAIIRAGVYTPISSTRPTGGASTTCGSTPSTPWCSTGGRRPSGPDDQWRMSGSH